MSDLRVEFHSVDKDLVPAPYPAVRGLSEWYQKLPGKIEVPGLTGSMRTVKQCPPFLDAMMTGYIIPLSGDVHFALDSAGVLTFNCPNGDATVEAHHPAQAAGSPWAHQPVIKFMNPWILVTPPGYSTLFLQPLNHERIPFEVFSGIVDTDTFYSQVNFPSACLMSPGTSCVLTRGTPLVQAIPFRREAWTSQVGRADAQRLADYSRSFTHAHHVYREQHHQRKSFE
jgi:hypothetical protein